MFSAGVVEQTFTVRVLADALDEYAEPFKIAITKDSNSLVTIAEGSEEVVTTILDSQEDIPPVINISDGESIKIEEPLTSEDFVEVTFTVSLTEPSAKEITVQYESQDGGGLGDAATGNDDYVPISGTLTFAPGETTATLTVLVRGDSVEESLESFSVVISNPTNATIGDDLGYASILDPSLQVGDNGDDGVTGTESTDVIIGDPGGVTETNPTISITYVLDTSGSMNENDRLATLQEAVKDLNAALKDLVDQGATVDINLIEFNYSNETEFLGSFRITDQDSLDDLNNEIDQLNANGWTSYTEALYEANQLFETGIIDPDAYDYTTVLFVSDGSPAGPVNPRYSNLIAGNREDETDTFNFMNQNNQALLHSLFPFLLLDSVVTRAVGVGDDIDQSTLDLLDSTGNALLVEDANLSDLSAIIAGVILETLIPLGEDVLNGGDGNDVIYGDTMGSDNFNAILANVFGGDEQALLDFVLDPENNYANARSLNNPDRGAADEIHGGAGDDVLFGEGGDDVIYGGDGDDLIFGGDGNDTISGGDGNDTIYGDAGSDTIDGGAGNDTIMYQAGEVDSFVDGGVGDDILQFDGNNLTLDLTNNNYNGVYHNFEKINLGGGDNSLNLNPDDVIEMTDNDNRIFVDGDSSDSVTGAGWTDTGTTVIDSGKSYTVYTGAGGAELLVKDDIDVSGL